MRLILYSKPGCHLCEGLQEKLEQIHTLQFDLEVRDITSREDWFAAYQFEIPVLMLQADEAAAAIPLPRLSPRGTVAQLVQMLRKYVQTDG